MDLCGNMRIYWFLFGFMLELFYFCSDKEFVMNKIEVKQVLINHLKKANAFWSYQVDAIKDVPDDILV